DPIQKDFDDTFEHAKQFAEVLDVPTVVDYLKKSAFRRRYPEWSDASRLLQDARAAIVRNDESPGWKQMYDLQKEGDGHGGIIATDGNWWSRREATSLANDVLRSLGQGDRVDVVAPYPGMFLATSAMLGDVRKGADVHLFTSENNSYHLH